MENDNEKNILEGIKMIKTIILCILSSLFRLVPRDNHLWVTGKTSSWDYINAPPAFFDNSKYFFLYLVNSTDEKVYWLSSSKQEMIKMQNMGLPVVRFPSLKGIWLVLRAKFSFHHYGTDQINRILQMGTVQLDFWHGTPLKKIRYDVVEMPNQKYKIIKDLFRGNGIEYVSSTSKYLSENILMRAFAASRDQMLEFGYPRMDVMQLSKEDSRMFCQKYSPELLPFIDKARGYSKVFLYMPTYRDDDPDYIDKAEIDYVLMSKKLKEIDGILFLKLHPLTRYTCVDVLDNIIQIGNDVDIYPFLIHTDYLITDYSSIFFDYLILNKEIIFIPFDYDNYLKHRDVYFDYDEITPGVKYESFTDFIENLSVIDKLDYSKERESVRDLMIDGYNYDACEKTYEYIKKKYQ